MLLAIKEYAGRKYTVVRTGTGERLRDTRLPQHFILMEVSLILPQSPLIFAGPAHQMKGKLDLTRLLEPSDESAVLTYNGNNFVSIKVYPEAYDPASVMSKLPKAEVLELTPDPEGA